MQRSRLLFSALALAALGVLAWDIGGRVLHGGERLTGQAGGGTVIAKLGPINCAPDDAATCYDENSSAGCAAFPQGGTYTGTLPFTITGGPKRVEIFVQVDDVASVRVDNSLNSDTVGGSCGEETIERLLQNGNHTVWFQAQDISDDWGQAYLHIEVRAFPPECGNEMTEAGEECDLGSEDVATCNYAGGDQRQSCKRPFCGDYYANEAYIMPNGVAEECDSGGINRSDCDSDCTLPMCGDGHVNNIVWEECDEGVEWDTATCNYADGQLPHACKPSRCGDGYTNEAAGEECDDGNTTAGDGCSTRCRDEENFCKPAPPNQCPENMGLNVDDDRCIDCGGPFMCITDARDSKYCINLENEIEDLRKACARKKTLCGECAGYDDNPDFCNDRRGTGIDGEQWACEEGACVAKCFLDAHCPPAFPTCRIEGGGQGTCVNGADKTNDCTVMTTICDPAALIPVDLDTPVGPVANPHGLVIVHTTNDGHGFSTKYNCDWGCSPSGGLPIIPGDPVTWPTTGPRPPMIPPTVPPTIGGSFGGTGLPGGGGSSSQSSGGTTGGGGFGGVFGGVGGTGATGGTGGGSSGGSSRSSVASRSDGSLRSSASSRSSSSVSTGSSRFSQSSAGLSSSQGSSSSLSSSASSASSLSMSSSLSSSSSSSSRSSSSSSSSRPSSVRSSFGQGSSAPQQSSGFSFGLSSLPGLSSAGSAGSSTPVTGSSARSFSSTTVIFYSSVPRSSEGASLGRSSVTVAFSVPGAAGTVGGTGTVGGIGMTGTTGGIGYSYTSDGYVVTIPPPYDVLPSGTSVRPIPRGPLCGNGAVDAGEECDDANARDFDGCSVECLLERGFCGDGAVQVLLDEQCEPLTHNPSLPYGCGNDCRFFSTLCGDAVVDSGEECDQGAANADTPNAYCRTNCSFARCGDGVVDTAAETCDDGNRRNNDGCSMLCQPERTAPVQPVGSVFTVPVATTLPSYQQQPVQATATAMLPAVPVTTASGPASIAVMAAGAAAGVGWMRRRRGRR